ncbi:MAG: T9SS C-terminal target domain-containing protein [Ignavibacteriae bacterium]|nr:MAG: T9SS C-terminal target domain-containing protein [Ignavibacteriota bacterium]
MKKLIKFLSPLNLFLALAILTGTLYTQDINNSNNVKTDTSWKYLGRPRPGLTPLRFPPDSLLATNNWMWHGTPIFAPDLKEMFWCRYNHSTEQGELVFIKYINGNWTPMQNAPFGNLNFFENNPHYSITGDTLFFVSCGQGRFVFRVVRAGSGWTEPEAVIIPIPAGYRSGMDFSFARNGNIYFGMVDTNHPLLSDLYRSNYINGQFQIPENLGNIINSDSGETTPFIDSYERFIIFASKRPGGYGRHDIYISKRNPDDTWSTPVNLGPVINSSTEDVFPYITPDSMYFFYETGKNQPIGYNPFWISAQYVYNLVAIGVNKQVNVIPKEFILYQNYPNPFNPTTKIKFDIASNVKSEMSNVKLIIYDVMGREITVLVNQKHNAGSYEVEWNASGYPSGIYFYTLTAGTFKAAKRMIIIK